MEELYTEPVSPTGQYFTSSVISVSVIAVLESEIPIDDSQTIPLLKDLFLPINPRFSSLMVTLSFYRYLSLCVCVYLYLNSSVVFVVLIMLSMDVTSYSINPC